MKGLLLLLLAVQTTALCVPGDATCTTLVSRASWCRRESETCHGAPHVKCYCDSPRSAAVVTTSSTPTMSVAAETQRVFMWLEWPDLESVAEWQTFFDSVIRFMESNCGGFSVWRLVVRVMDPFLYARIGKLWQVSTESVFYTHLIARLRSDVELVIYPYLLEERAARWSQAMGTRGPLEAVFKFAHQWNTLLRSTGSRTRITGIATDFEESETFEAELPAIPDYKRAYAVDGARVRFGTAFGFDQPRRAAEVSPHIDDVYLEMYDLYEAETGIRVEQGKGPLVNHPRSFLDKLDADIWPHLLEHYDQDHLHFMWSLQARSSNRCLYKHDGLCGTKDDFGRWSAPKVSEFLALVEARHPSLRTHRKGFFQFSYTPESWLGC